MFITIKKQFYLVIKIDVLLLVPLYEIRLTGGQTLHVVFKLSQVTGAQPLTDDLLDVPVFPKEILQINKRLQSKGEVGEWLQGLHLWGERIPGEVGDGEIQRSDVEIFNEERLVLQAADKVEEFLVCLLSNPSDNSLPRLFRLLQQAL